MKEELTEQEIIRRNKLEEIAKYTNPYPDKYEKQEKYGREDRADM